MAFKLSTLASLLLACTAAAAAQSTPALQIGMSNGTNYRYAGCWNETTDLPDTTGLRALDGVHEVLEGTMTVAKCLDFCAHGNKTYPFAGLEFSRECWCADRLNSLSVRLDDAACDTPCDGANTTACGGALKLSLFNATGAAVGVRVDGTWGVLVAGLVSGLVLGGL